VLDGPDPALQIRLEHFQQQIVQPVKIIVHLVNRGVSVARNSALHAASGAIFAFLCAWKTSQSKQ
jgi:glycosyltransferase involved in cell wall biosynthesis